VTCREKTPGDRYDCTGLLTSVSMSLFSQPSPVRCLASQRSKDFNRARDEIVDELWDLGKTSAGNFLHASLELTGG